jgi:hypothetical protein
MDNSFEGGEKIDGTSPPESTFLCCTRNLTIGIAFAPDQFDPWKISLIEEFVQVFHKQSIILQY